MLIENQEVASDVRELVKILNEYVSSILSNLDIKCPLHIILHHDPVLNAIKKIWKLRWLLTATTITKRNTVKKENFT